MAEERQVNIELGASVSPKASRSFSKLQKSARALKKSLKAAFGVAKTVGLPAFAAATATIGISTRNAKNFGIAMAEVSTLVDTATINMEELEKGVLAVSTATGKDAIEVAKGLYQTISSGAVDAADSIKFLNTVTDSAIAGVSSIADAVDLTTSIMNAYGKEVFSVQKIQDVAFKTVEKGVTTFGQLAASMGEVIPFAAQLDISIEDLFGAVATLTRGGIKTANATTFLKNVFVATLNPTKQVKEAAAEMGIEFNAARLQSIGLANFLKEVQIATKGNTAEMARLFPNVRGLTAVLTLAGKQADTFREITEELTNSFGAQQRAAEKVKEALKFDIVLNEFKNLSIGIGKTFLPVITDALKGLSDQFKEWDEDGTLAEWLASFEGWVKDVGATAKTFKGIFQVGGEIFRRLNVIRIQAEAFAEEEFAGLPEFLGFDPKEREALRKRLTQKAFEATLQEGRLRTEAEERIRTTFGEARNLAAAAPVSGILAAEESGRRRNVAEQGKIFADEFDQHIQQAIDDFRLNIGIGLRRKKAEDLVRAPLA